MQTSITNHIAMSIPKYVHSKRGAKKAMKVRENRKARHDGRLLISEQLDESPLQPVWAEVVEAEPISAPVFVNSIFGNREMVS